MKFLLVVLLQVPCVCSIQEDGENQSFDNNVIRGFGNVAILPNLQHLLHRRSGHRDFINVAFLVWNQGPEVEVQ